MESVSHSSKRTSSSSTAAYNGVKSKTMNEDFFGGPPRFGAVPATLSPRVEDYAEIVGGCHASSSRSSSSIPVLDLPSASHYEFDARAPSAFEYADVFGGFDELDFAVSYEELLRMMMMAQSSGQDGFPSEDDDDDDVWTLSEAEYPSEESNVKNHRFSNGDLCESADGSMEFSISCHKAGQTSNGDLSNGIAQITQICAVPENSFAVDRSSSFSKTDDEYLPYKVSNGLLNADLSGEMISGRLLRKTMSQPANGGADGSLFSNKVKPHKGYARNGSFPNETFVTISDVSLRTQPSNLPPPRRPPPALDDEKIGSGEFHSYHGDLSFEGSIGDTSPSYFDVEVDASSSAAASAAAMREAMKKAQAKLKIAKELMERKRECEQTCRKSGSKKSSKDREGKVIHASDGSSGTRDERLQSTSGKQENRVELPVFQEKQKVAQTTQLTPDSAEMKISQTLTKKYTEKQGRESLSCQGSAEIDGAGEWKEAIQYFELVKMDKVRKPFDQASDGNIWLQSVSINELEKKEKKAGMEGLERNDMNKEAVQAKSQLERNNVRSKAAKVVKGHQGLDNMLSVEEASRWDENDKKLRVDQQPVDTDKKEAITDSVQKHEKRSESKKISKQNIREPQTSEADKCIRGGIEKARLEDDEKKTKMALEKAENERLKEAFEQEEKKSRVRQIHELEKNDKKQKEAYERDESEKRVKEALELEESKRRQKEVLEKEAKDRKIKETREKEKSERKGKEAAEREESEKRGKEAQEREEKEKRMKETIEREKERRHRELVEQGEKEKKQMELREREKNEKMLTEALEREENERRIKEAATREENERRQREYHEREEKENRLREALEQEENKKKRQEDCKQQESQQRNKEALENEDSKRRIEKDLLGEDIGKGMEKACEKEENGKTPRAAGDRGCGIGEKEAYEPEETGNRTAEFHKLKNAGRSEAVTLNGTSNMGLNHIAVHSDFKLDNTELLRASRVTAKHESDSGKVERGIANEENFKTPTELRLREKAATLGSMNEPNDRRTTVMGMARVGVEFGGNKLPSEESATENLKKAVEVGDTIEQKKLEQNISASPLDSSFGHPGKKATHERNEKGKNMEQAQVIFSQEGMRDNSGSSRMVKETVESQRKKEVSHSSKLEMKESVQRTAQNPVFGQTVEGKVKNLNTTALAEEKESGRVKRDKELEQEQEQECLRKLEEEREREREKDRMAVDRSTLEGRAYAESRERAERAAVERIMNEARERLEKACAEAREKLLTDKPPVEARLRVERAAVERAAAEARERAFQKAMAERATMEIRDQVESSGMDNLSALSRNGIRPSSSFHSGPYCMERSGADGESPQRCKARLERHQRTAERAAKALAEKNMRDLLAQREQAERNRLAETLDADVKRWSSGKEGNLRALLSTLQYILGTDSGWQPVPLTEVITAAAVKKAYRKATLCVHPDKLQQRGASIQQKYVCEKVFDLLKEAWNRFNSEER